MQDIAREERLLALTLKDNRSVINRMPRGSSGR